MNRETYLNNIKDTLKSAYPIVERKSADYADDNPFKNFEASEIIGLDPKKVILSRTIDKISRINNILYRNPEVTEEQIEDTILDGINYLAILKARVEYERSLGGEKSNVTSPEVSE